MGRHFRYWLPPVLWMGCIFFISSLPAKEIPEVGIPHIDKVAHLVEYGILGALVRRAFFYSFPRADLIRAAILCMMMALAFAAFDEWHQRFIPGRTVDLYDLMANACGIGIGVIICSAAERKRHGNDQGIQGRPLQ